MAGSEDGMFVARRFTLLGGKERHEVALLVAAPEPHPWGVQCRWRLEGTDHGNAALGADDAEAYGRALTQAEGAVEDLGRSLGATRVTWGGCASGTRVHPLEEPWGWILDGDRQYHWPPGLNPQQLAARCRTLGSDVVKELHVRETVDVGDAHWDALAKALPQLESVSVDGDISVRLSTLVDAFAELTRLTVWASPTDEPVVDWAGVEASALASIHLGYLRTVTDDLLRALSRTESLRSLSLMDCRGFGSDGLAALGRSASLRYVDLLIEEGPVGEAAIFALLRAPELVGFSGSGFDPALTDAIRELREEHSGVRISLVLDEVRRRVDAKNAER